MRVKTSPDSRDRYHHFVDITTRWMDNDAYGHVNNVVYYSFFDTAVNQFLIRSGCLDIRNDAVVGLVVETKCEYFRSLAFPDDVQAGLRVARLGRSSVRYEIGLFRAGEGEASAQGHFVHVYVDRATQAPIEIPAATRSALQPLCGEPPSAKSPSPD
ncbi:MAG: thioesterase family protein [Microvirga sp.]